MTASPSAGREPTPGPPDQVALSLLTFGRGPDADRALWARLIRQARCADSGLDADQWFPVSATAESAVGEAADALAVCRSCPVRSLCLALSLLHWDVGQYGVWGGLVAADRASLRRQMLAPGPESGTGPQHDALSLLPLASHGPGPQRGFPAGTMGGCAGQRRHDVPPCRQDLASAAPGCALSTRAPARALTGATGHRLPRSWSQEEES